MYDHQYLLATKAVAVDVIETIIVFVHGDSTIVWLFAATIRTIYV